MAVVQGELEPLELEPLFPIHLYALLNPAEGFEDWSLAEALRHLERADPDLKVALPGTNRLAGALETVGVQLEGGAPGSRFPLIWTIALSLTGDETQGWDASELDALTQELRTISVELERLPVVAAASIQIQNDGFPGMYSRTSEHLASMSPTPYRNLGAMMEPVLGAVREMTVRASVRGHSVALVREGVPVNFWGRGG